jgi:hypothetical protein
MPAPTVAAIDIQYWFFYPYRGDISGVEQGVHEGDWEHITVRVTRDGKNIIAIYYTFHSGEGRWNEKFDVVPNTKHPVVYSAWHSHASYPTAGIHGRPFPLPDDKTDDGGARWQCWNHIVNVGEKHAPLNGQNWLQFTGRWGGSRGSGLGETPSPETPSFKNSWKDDGGGPPCYNPNLPIDLPTSVEEINASVPKSVTLEQNYPNPFNPETAIAFDLLWPANVKLIVFDFLGREVATLIEAAMPAGKHHIVWNGKDKLGVAVASGIYFYRLQAVSPAGKNTVLTRKMTLLR